MDIRNQASILRYQVSGMRLDCLFCDQNAVLNTKKEPEALENQGLPDREYIIPTRCRDLYLKQLCLEDIAPAVLIILITHIIVAVRWMLIKILSAVIKCRREYKVIVAGDLCIL